MFPVTVLLLLTVVVVLLAVLLLRPRPVDSRDDIARLRQAQSEDARGLREELAGGLQRYAMQTDQRAESLRTAVLHQLGDAQRGQRAELESIRTALDQRLAA